jgi:hypothetical protein
MPYDFPGSGGAVVQSLGTVATTGKCSMGAWWQSAGFGTSNIGGICAIGTKFALQWNASTAGKMRFASGRATTNGNWETTAAFGTPHGVPRWLGVTYDGASVNNHPIYYLLDETGQFQVLTNGAGLTRTQAPAGTQDADAAFFAGRGTNQPWVGMLGHAFFYARVLDEYEMRSIVFRGIGSVLRDIRLWYPMERYNVGAGGVEDYSGLHQDASKNAAVTISTSRFLVRGAAGIAGILA